MKYSNIMKKGARASINAGIIMKKENGIGEGK